MSNYRPLTSNPNKDAAALLIDAGQPFAVLDECAEHRLYVAKNLLNSLACMKPSSTDAHDVSNIAEAAYLLIEDAYDLMRAARVAAVREGRRNE